MKALFYRLSWDEEFKHKFIKWSCIGIFSFAIALALTVVLIGNLSVALNEEDFEDFNTEEEDSGSFFDLRFGERQNKKEEGEEPTKKNNEGEEQGGNDNNSSSGGSWINGGDNRGSGSGDGGGGSQHQHQWYRVVDSQPWDETYWVQTGTRYICNSCGFSCTDSGSASAHSNQTGHKFRSEGIMEMRTRHHAGVSHEECSCGARR